MKKNLIIIAVNILLLTAFIICLSLTSSIVTPLRSQQVAETWAGQSGERFAQLSVFFPESHTFDNNDIRSLHSSIDTALLTVSLESTPDRRLYTDAWSGVVDISIFNERSPVSARAIAVGGDFFLFHPLNLRSGGYISPNDLMKDRVVLDEALAWRLFGSVDLVGFQIFIEDKPFYIAGVISRESDFANSKAYSDGAGLFMSFEAAMEITGDDVSIKSYEIVMPDPITGFALNSLTDAISDDTVHIIENSARFSFENSFAAIRSFGERSMRTDTIEYPYWENAARYIEELLALLLALAILSIIFPVVCGVVYTVKVIRFLIKRGKITAKKLIENYDKRQYDKYMAKQGKIPDKSQESNDGEDNEVKLTDEIDDIIEPDQKPDENHETYSLSDILREANGDNY